MKAKESLAAGEKEAAAIVDAAVKAAQEEARAIASKVAQESAMLEERVAAEAQTEIERILKAADSRRGEAVEAVIQKVLKTIS